MSADLKLHSNSSICQEGELQRKAEPSPNRADHSSPLRISENAVHESLNDEVDQETSSLHHKETSPSVTSSKPNLELNALFGTQPVQAKDPFIAIDIDDSSSLTGDRIIDFQANSESESLQLSEFSSTPSPVNETAFSFSTHPGKSSSTRENYGDLKKQNRLLKSGNDGKINSHTPKKFTRDIFSSGQNKSALKRESQTTANSELKMYA